MDYKSPITIRDSAVLTGSYVAGTVINTGGQFNQLVLNMFYTQGSLTSLQIKVEFSADNVTFVQETFQSISGGTATETQGEHTFTGTGNFSINIPNVQKFIKVSAKGTGTVTGSSLSIQAILART